MLKNNSKKFWEVVNPKPSSSSLVSITKNGEPVLQSEVADELNTFFCLVFTSEEPIPLDLSFFSLNTSMNDLIITREGVEAAIDRLPVNSAPGPDNICSKLLKLTKPSISRILVAIFQQSVDTGCVPDACARNSHF